MKFFTTIFSFIFLTICLHAQSGNYTVQVGAFNTKVASDYFKELEGVTYYKDHNDIHRYYIMGIGSKTEADSKAENARKLGFKAVVIDNDEVAKNCRITCGASKEPAPSAALTWIFFDFDKADLRNASKVQLDKLVNILTENPTYIAELNANTDAKGSNEYNVALSNRRATNAKNYCVSKGINAARLKTTTNGETAPIAKNALASGNDTEVGRQYNRRVEIKVLDASGKVLSNLVDIPNIPNSLKN